MLILRRVQLWCWSINLRLVVTNVCTPAKSFHLWTATYFKHFKERAVITGFSQELIFTIFLICVLTLLPSLQSHDQVMVIIGVKVMIKSVLFAVSHFRPEWKLKESQIIAKQSSEHTLIKIHKQYSAGSTGSVNTEQWVSKSFQNVFFWSINQTFEKNLTFDILPDITGENGVVTAESTICLSLVIKRCKCLAIFWRRNFT